MLSVMHWGGVKTRFGVSYTTAYLLCYKRNWEQQNYRRLRKQSSLTLTLTTRPLKSLSALCAPSSNKSPDA
jgi:hypothetical protein